VCLDDDQDTKHQDSGLTFASLFLLAAGVAGTLLDIENGRTHSRRDSHMKTLWRSLSRLRPTPRILATAAFGLLLAAPVFAQATGTSPWENAVQVLQTAFTSTIARGLSLVAIVVAGLTFAFGEGGSKRILAGVLFGVGMAIAAVNFLSWLFPGS
jgi:type IV secretory pathway VirB2 component (pilin)